MVYQLSYGDGKDCSDACSTIRDYWRRSYGGAYMQDFTSGYDSGVEDLANDSYDGLTALKVVEVSQRKQAWEAQLDGYKYATKSRGPTEFG
jgi:hypothetical protein